MFSGAFGVQCRRLQLLRLGENGSDLRNQRNSENTPVAEQGKQFAKINVGVRVGRGSRDRREQKPVCVPMGVPALPGNLACIVDGPRAPQCPAGVPREQLIQIESLPVVQSVARPCGKSTLAVSPTTWPKSLMS